MPTGTIEIKTVTGGVLPCPEVQITLTDAAGAEQSFFTDASGSAGPVEAAAPPRALSLTRQLQEQPYAVFEITAEKEGYIPVIISGVQVFEGCCSLQKIRMEPVDAADSPFYSEDNRIRIPPHHLCAGEEPPRPAAPQQPCENTRILNEVIIPEYITVHLGKPQSPARNVTVSFRDYIKNVASSEIYPTWPENALRANIYCQISLALNRVYTEWYLSKGYTFQITNSTSYDQYFVYGRNIFENISRLVDELFTTYIRRPGQINPFYAEYCDGQSVTCPGLKQWGTVTLANQGYTPYGILQYYYGSIELTRAQKLAGIPQSYPGTALRPGSSGMAVRTVQRQLNRIAQNYPGIGTQTVDGVYGSAAEEAVRRFQRQFNLSADGVVGFATWYRISYIYVAVKKLAELSSEGEYPNSDSVADAEGRWPGIVLRPGSRGTAVKQVQFWLNTVRGYIPGLPLLRVDGIYGSGTAQAVRVFQNWAGLKEDGLAGRDTWNALYREYTSVMLEENEDLDYLTQYPGSVQKPGSRGSAVRSLQFWLSVISDKYPSVPAVTVDGIYGSATADAVRAFQTTFGLAADGLVGIRTWSALRQVFAYTVLDLEPGNQLPGTYPGTALRRGSSGSAVREMQYYLYVVSTYFITIPELAYDGVFGRGTERSVIAFQELFGLAADGVVGRATWNALYAAYVRVITVEGMVRSVSPAVYAGELSVGSRGEAVRRLQRALELVSLFYPAVRSPIAPPNVTVEPVPPAQGSYDEEGYYGLYTEEAVRSFQLEFSLEVTGTADEATWNRLELVYSTISAQDVNGDRSRADGSWPGGVLQTGACGPFVRQLQRLLNRMADSFCEAVYVPVDGIYGPDTQRAVCCAQRGAQLPESGGVTRATWEAICAVQTPPDAGRKAN